MINVNTSTIGENGMGKETSVCETYVPLLCLVESTTLADTGVTIELPPESEPPGYAKGLPIDVYVDCIGKPEVVD